MAIQHELPPRDRFAPAEIALQADGRVASARALQGPDFLHRNAVEAALKWRFEPLAQAGFQAPQIRIIHFHYSTHQR